MTIFEHVDLGHVADDTIQLPVGETEEQDQYCLELIERRQRAGHSLYAFRLDPDDEMTNRAMSAQGWAMRWEIYEQIDKGRFVVVYLFDGPLYVGAGVRWVEKVFHYGTHENLEQRIMAWHHASTFVIEDITRQMRDNG